MNDLELQVEIKKGDEGYQDILCDYKFMLGITCELGNSIRSTYRSIKVFDEDIIYLVMNNVVGHGENEAVLEYSEYLELNYKIVVY